MPEILVEINCGEETCDECEMKDVERKFCEVFQEFLEDDLRAAECLNAEEVANALYEEEEDD